MPNRTHLQGLSATPEHKACLAAWLSGCLAASLPDCLRCPYSVDPEAVLGLIVEGQLTCSREEANCERKDMLVILPSLQHNDKEEKIGKINGRNFVCVLVFVRWGEDMSDPNAMSLSCFCFVLFRFCALICMDFLNQRVSGRVTVRENNISNRRDA